MAFSASPSPASAAPARPISAGKPLDVSDKTSFLTAAALGLHLLEHRERSSRRFGPDADRRWAALGSNLGPALRFELLLRDAAAAWGIAFSPALTFSLEGLSAEEPMGPQWGRHFGNREKRYSDWFTPRAQEPSWSDFLGAWHRSNLPPAPSLPELGPGRTYLVAGLSVLPSLSSAFAVRSDLDWARQVRLVSADPCERQLSGIAAIYAGAAKAAPLIDPTAADPTLTDPTSPAGANPPRSTGRPSGILVLGADATPAARAFLGA